MSTDKPNKLKARLPRGLADRGPAEIAATRRMLETIRRVFERYGFEPVETPQIEYTDALGKFLPDQDRPNEGVFSFQDDDEQWLSLRYDLTAPLARYVAENFDALPKPYRSYRFGYVYRNEKPGPGRFRQFMQFDADTVGSASPAADAEVCMMIADTMEELGLGGNYVVKVNNRKVLDGLMESIQLAGESNASKRLTVFRAIDKLDRLGEEGVAQLLGAGRKDESGDRTEGAGLEHETIREILFFFDITYSEGGDPTAPRWRKIKSGLDPRDSQQQLRWLEQRLHATDLGRRGIFELKSIAELIEASGYSDRVFIDPSIVRGLEYYTGPVFEVELTFPVEGDDGKPVRFGSVAGGGRYDGLVGRFRGDNVPATGISIGVSRLMAALQHLKKVETNPEAGPVVVTVFDSDRIADYQKMVAALRGAGIRAELYLGNPKNKPNQFKYADRRRSPCAIIQGGDERDHPSGTPHVLIRDLIAGAANASITDREEYKAAQAKAQYAVPEGELVAEV
ncbi:MAG: histidyl-tRNA synthetase, partial [Hyphomicrobiales bacterium]|nr:histidyl-tRNA synthetase [Hyphomicrobiales bacterium]